MSVLFFGNDCAGQVDVIFDASELLESGTVSFCWDTIPERYYTLSESDDLSDWTVTNGTLPAHGEINSTTYDHVLGSIASAQFFQITEGRTVSEPENLLFIILDDWGIDASPIDNSVPPAGQLANMPHLADLAADGVRFTNFYVVPSCAPTRAAIMTGRHAHQTDVYVAGNSRLFSVNSDELTIAEAMDAAGSTYAKALVGKWHLGSADDAYDTVGGWDEFYGIENSGVADYFSWDKNTNGTVATSTTYTTTDQVNEAVDFIARSELASKPWFCWLAFNAPHSPFHDPPTTLAPVGGYSTQQSGESNNAWRYRKMLEALDTELGRLMESVDLTKTNVILIGDNGTPGGAVQAPFGSGRAKGSLYEGGTRVPLVVAGPSVTVSNGSTTDELVHAVDLFPTLLELVGVDPETVASSEVLDQTRSFLPILVGDESADRFISYEGGDGGVGGDRARGIRVEAYSDYKLIIFSDPEDDTVPTSFEFYDLSNDENEQSPLDTQNLDATEQAAYDACLAIDAALGGGFLNP
ncbi:MAG: sulfatase-like hydrolase/transferase [Verrucomicrobiota bacterium]